MSAPHFAPLTIHDSAESWGPVGVNKQLYPNLPFQPFNKTDRLGRISDWTVARDNANRGWNKFTDASALQTKEEDELGAFAVVDNKPKLKPRYGFGSNFRPVRGGGGGGGGGQQKTNQQNRPQQSTGTWGQRAAGTWVKQGGAQQQSSRANQPQRTQQGMRQQRNQRNQRDRPQAAKEFSVAIQDDWKLVDSVELSDLSNLVADVQDEEDLVLAGTLEQYNAAFNRITPKAPVTLQRFETRQHFTASTSEDPVLERLAKEKTGNVYATDTILSLLMSAPRSVNSWDIIVRKENGAVYLDKRPLSRIDYLSVNENFNDFSSPDNVNHPENLSLEATFINHNFSQQCLSANTPLEFDETNPFLSSLQAGNEPASVAFRYRKFQLPGGVNLVARTSLNGYNVKGEETAYICTRALNEYDSKLAGHVDWRQKLESQTGAVLASEMKNNSFKLARWVAECILSGADEFKLGFVSRVNPRNNYKHAVLMTKQYTPQTFADSVNVRVRQLWGTLNTILDQFRKLEDGDYLMIRDPNKPTLHIYRTQPNAFAHEAEQLQEEQDEQAQ